MQSAMKVNLSHWISMIVRWVKSSVFSAIVGCPASVGCPTVALEARPSSNAQQVLDAQPSRWKLDHRRQMPSKCWIPNRRVGSSTIIEYPASIGCPTVALEARPSSNAQPLLWMPNRRVGSWKLNNF